MTKDHLCGFAGCLAAILLLNGCANGPAFSEMKSSITTLDPRLGRIFVYRTYNYVGSGVQPDLMLNGSKAGTFLPNGFFYLDRLPGDYALLIPGRPGLFGISEFKMEVNLHAGQTIYIKYVVGMSGYSCTLVNTSVGEKQIKHLRYDGYAEEPSKAAKNTLETINRQEEAEQNRQREIAERKRADEASRNEFIRLTDQDDGGKALFKLQPDAQFSISQVTEFLITWKNRHLDSVLRNAKTAELHDYVDEIEHTVFQATDASEKEKDEAQRLIAGGANDEHQHTDLARAYRLRIEVLKPILAALKEEIANRGK